MLGFNRMNSIRENRGLFLRIGLCSVFNYPWGGAEKHVKQLSAFLTNSGHKIFHFSAFNKHPLNRSSGGFIRSAFHLSRKPIIEDLFYDCGILYYTLRLHRFAIKEKIDILHFHYVDFIPTSIFLRKLDKVPVVVTLHWYPLDYPPELASRFWHSRIFSIHQYLMFIHGVRNATKVLSPSKYYADLVEKKCGVRPIVIPNPICLQDFEHLPSREEAREMFGIDATDIVIAYTGRLDSEKGVIYLIKAFKNIIKECPSAKLFIVGVGPLMDELVNFVEAMHLKNVVFTGYMERSCLNKLLAAADVYVSPSVVETFGLSVLEALASGLPIVATRVGGVPEIVENGQNGFLVPARNPKALSDAMLRIIFNESIQLKFRENNKIRAKKYSSDIIFPQISSVYNDAVCAV